MADITYLTRIIFDFGAIKRLRAELADLGVTRPFIVTDAGLAKSPLLARIEAEADFAARFTETPSNPTEEAVEACAALFRRAACDGLVALGGGSPMDLAKAVAVRVTHDRPLGDYAAIRGGVARIHDVVPLIAVPTTAGTGSEVGRGALITLTEGAKLALISPHLVPKRAICDPELTLGLPPSLTAATGIDALTHCVEVFLSPLVNPPAEAIALDGAQRAWRWLIPATEDGGNREARWQMMMAALHGGLGFQKGLGAVHALSHAAGAIKDPVLHHGTLNGVFLPFILRFNAGHVGDKYDRLKQALGLDANADLADAVTGLLQRLRMPVSLGAMGFRPDHIAGTVARAVEDHSNATTPRKACAQDYEEILRAAL